MATPEQLRFQIEAREMPHLIGGPISEVRIEAHQIAEKARDLEVGDGATIDFILKNPTSLAASILEPYTTYLFLGGELQSRVDINMDEMLNVPHIHTEPAYHEGVLRERWTHTHLIGQLLPTHRIVFKKKSLK